jgi:prepilin signal peptidase PulO-like enzyme (type II secretory pathway)
MKTIHTGCPIQLRGCNDTLGGMKTSEVFEKLKHSGPLAFWFYTHIPFALFVALGAAITYLLYLLTQK